MGTTLEDGNEEANLFPGGGEGECPESELSGGVKF